MSKRLQREIKRLQKEGILDRIFKGLASKINNMSEKEYLKVKRQYDKDVGDLMDKIRDADSRLAKTIG